MSRLSPSGLPPGYVPPTGNHGTPPHNLYVYHADHLIDELDTMPFISNGERFDWMSLKIGKKFGPGGNLLPEKTYKMIGKAILNAHNMNYLVLRRGFLHPEGQVVFRIDYSSRNMNGPNGADPGAASAVPGAQGNNEAGPGAQGNNGAGPGAQGGRYRRSCRSRRSHRSRKR